MSGSVWFGELLTMLSLMACLSSWAIVFRAHVRDWPTPERRRHFLRRATPWTWVVTFCFLLTFAIQLEKWGLW